MIIRLPGWGRRGAPMLALFLATFATTLVLQWPRRESATPLVEAFAALPVVPLHAASATTDAALAEDSAGLMPELVEPEASVFELAQSADSGTQAEARVLLALLGEEGRSE